MMRKREACLQAGLTLAARSKPIQSVQLHRGIAALSRSYCPDPSTIPGQLVTAISGRLIFVLQPDAAVRSRVGYIPEDSYSSRGQGDESALAAAPLVPAVPTAMTICYTGSFGRLLVRRFAVASHYAAQRAFHLFLSASADVDSCSPPPSLFISASLSGLTDVAFDLAPTRLHTSFMLAPICQ